MDTPNYRKASIYFDDETVLEVEQRGGGGSGVGGDTGLSAVNLITGESTNDALADKDEMIAEQAATIEEQAGTIEEQAATIEAKDVTIAEKDATIAEKDATIADKDATIAEKDATITGLESQIANAYTVLRPANRQINITQYPDSTRYPFIRVTNIITAAEYEPAIYRCSSGTAWSGVNDFGFIYKGNATESLETVIKFIDNAGNRIDVASITGAPSGNYTATIKDGNLHIKANIRITPAIHPCSLSIALDNTPA